MSRSLLYYNPNVVTHVRNHDLPGIQAFSFFFKIFNPTVVLVDRTGTIKIPVNVKSLFPMPSFRPISKTYEDICNERALELLKRADTLGVGLKVFWSGGIDSTLLLIMLIRNATPAQRENITVLMTDESISENPNFYRDHIRGKIRIDSSTMFPYLLGGRDILIGGEHNDQLFGSDMVAHLIIKYGTDIINQPYSRDKVFDFFDEKLKKPRDQQPVP